MPVVVITQSPRSVAEKGRMISAVTSALVTAYDIRPEQVSVYVHEVDDENWGRGGRLATDKTDHEQGAS